VRTGRLSRLRVLLDDRPGTLSRLLRIVGDAGGNVLEVHHERLFADLPVKLVDVDLSIETADAEHRDAVVKAILEAGYRVAQLPLDIL
jgi:threonine dehydratase